MSHVNACCKSNIEKQFLSRKDTAQSLSLLFKSVFQMNLILYEKEPCRESDKIVCIVLR